MISNLKLQVHCFLNYESQILYPRVISIITLNKRRHVTNESEVMINDYVLTRRRDSYYTTLRGGGDAGVVAPLDPRVTLSHPAENCV